MINKVVFFVGNLYLEKDHKRFGYETISNRGYEVEVWDFTPWLNYNYYIKHRPHSKLSYKNYKTLHTNEQIKSAISELSSNDIIIDYIVLSNKKTIFENLKFKKTKIAFTILGQQPLMNSSPIIDRIKYYFTLILNEPINFFSKIYNFFCLIIKNLIKREKSHDLINILIVGGSEWKNNADKQSFNNEVDLIKAHAFDYDRYIELKNTENKINQKKNYNFSVFLDEALPFHPDYDYLKIKPYCSSKNYYYEINNFFDDYENKTGYQIIIAACPRIDYKLRNNPYNNRKIVSSSSTSLVKNSKHVLTHMSTAVNFAILYKKPIIFINSNNYSFYLKNSIKNLSRSVEGKYINITKNLPSNYSKISVNEKLYKIYKEKFIKEPNTPDKFIWDIFCDYLDKVNNSSKNIL